MRVPQSLVVDGRLAFHDIYLTATLSERNAALVRGSASDAFPAIVPGEPWDSTGVLPTCKKGLTYGDAVSHAQWPSLQVWHAGLSCHLQPNSHQDILFDLNDANFLNEFNVHSRSQYLSTETGDYRVLLVYKLSKGSAIPDTIGIERDGENHVCLYPIGKDIAISEIEAGLFAFTIDALMPLQAAWSPFAIIKVRASGFNFPVEFPLDSDVFPFRRWLSAVIKVADSDIAMHASNYTKEYICGRLGVFEYMSKMLSIARNYGEDCDCDHIEMNLCITKALSFALNANLLFEKKKRTSFIIKSSSRIDERAERNLVMTTSNAFESVSRTALAIEGGRPVISAAASIYMLYIDAQLCVPIALPFKVAVNGVDVLFDEMEPSLVAEDAEPTVDGSDVCEEIVESCSPNDVNYDQRICIEVSKQRALLVKLTEEEYSKLTQECATCLGYTTKQGQCKNKRKSLRGEKFGVIIIRIKNESSVNI